MAPPSRRLLFGPSRIAPSRTSIRERSEEHRGRERVEFRRVLFRSVGDSARFSPSLVDQHGAAVEAAFVWTVEDSAVAHVDTRGVVRAVGPGTTSVTVSAQGASATAELTVNSPPPPPHSL